MRTLSWITQLVSAAAMIALLAATAGTQQTRSHNWLAAAAAILLIPALQTFVHEFGHLTAGLLMRLRVVSFTYAGGRLVHWRWGGATFGLGLRGRSFVRFRIEPTRRAFARRYAAMIAAGPIANLLTVAAAVLAARGSGVTSLEKAILYFTAAQGVILGIGNLIPVGNTTTRLTDGKNLIHWLRRPTEAVHDVRRVQVSARLEQHRATLKAGGKLSLSDVAALRVGADRNEAEGEIDTAARVALTLLAADASEDGRAAFDIDRGRFIRLARREDLNPALSSQLASTTAWIMVYRMFGDYVRQRTPLDPGVLATAEELAAAARRRDPGSARARYALAMVRCVQTRPEEARKLLLMIEPTRLSPAERVNLWTVRALAELLLKDREQARRLVEAARRERSPLGLLDVVSKLIERADQAAA